MTQLIGNTAPSALKPGDFFTRYQGDPTWKRYIWVVDKTEQTTMIRGERPVPATTLTIRHVGSEFAFESSYYEGALLMRVKPLRWSKNRKSVRWTAP